MAETVYAKRIQELKERIARKDPSFQLVYNAFDELCGVKRLSRVNIIWARKQLVRFRDLWIDEDSKRLLDKLALRVEHAAAKWQRRDDERAAAKASGVKKRSRKEDKQTTKNAGTSTSTSISAGHMESLMNTIDKQEEKERLIGFEIMRLMGLARNTEVGSLLDAALAGREQNVESVSKLFAFVLRNFGDFPSNIPSTVVEKFWGACSEFLTASGWTAEQLEELRNPFSKAGDPGFRSVLDELEEGRS